MSRVFSIPTKNSFSNRPATVQVVRDSTTRESRSLVADNGHETASVRLDEATIRQIVDALTGTE